jgi:flavin-dependent dehydrogenase
MRKKDMISHLTESAPNISSSPKLVDGSRVAVMGAGPAGSFFAYFLLDLAQRVRLSLQVDLYEPRDFSRPGPASCNMDAGIISESLVQHLAAEGINLPPSVIQQGIDSYVLHMDVGSVRIEAPIQEKRIASVYRGAGPMGSLQTGTVGFDAFCLSMALQKGARLVPQRVEEVSRADTSLLIRTRGRSPVKYDLLAVATGVNTNALRLFSSLEPRFHPPVTVRSMVREYWLGAEVVEEYLGSSFHVFLLDLPGLDFAGIVPKGDHATVCFLGNDISEEVFAAFLDSPQVRQCMPPGWEPGQYICHCMPRMQIGGAIQPFAERMVFVGDSGVSRLYKDGIGAAYRTAKAAARTVIFYGIGHDDFQAHFWPVCRAITDDNRFGKIIFAASRQIQHRGFARRGLRQMIIGEQGKPAGRRRASSILWDTFTGSAPYRDIFQRTLHPAYLAGFIRYLAVSALQGDGHWNRLHTRQLPLFTRLARGRSTGD